jgi:D-3-phosphoglycerate dehydrogenase
MKVLFVDSVHSILEERLENLGFTCAHDYSSNRTDLLAKIANYQGLVLRSRTAIDAEFLEAATSLKFIARSGAGLENLDCEKAKGLGIHLFSAPEGNRQAVGEHALGMLLNLFNKLSTADSEVRSGKWNREANRGIELSGKTVGIIGYGNMGKAFAKCISGFNCTVLAFDNTKAGYSDEYTCESTLENIQENADIISFHTPYNESTHHYLDSEFLAKMHKPFYIINTARGKVVRTESLVKGLQDGTVLGACLDVLEFEKASFENMFDTVIPTSFQYLLDSKKVLLSPHVAGWTVESYYKLSSVLADKIEKVFNKSSD